MTSRIVDYKIIRGSHLYESLVPVMAEEVNKAIAEGWEPIGGLCSTGEERCALYQAMVRREKSPDPN
jgi:hypothetical protein